MTKTVFTLALIFLFIELCRRGINCTSDVERGVEMVSNELSDCGDQFSFSSSCKCCDGNSCPEKNKCSLCPEGHYLEHVPCSQCKNGSHCNTSLQCNGGISINYSQCHPCKQGYYQPQKQKDECLKCPPGYQAISVGAVLCSACPRGHYKNTSMTSCQPCPAGQESIGEASPSCTPCLEGTHKSIEGPQFCEPCVQGYYILTKEALYCIQCPVDFYCPCSKCGPVPCPDGANCPKGSSSPIYCSSPLYRWVTDGCYISTTLIGIIVAVILFSFLILSVIVARMHLKPHRRPSNNWTSIGEESTSSEPVYSGL